MVFQIKSLLKVTWDGNHAVDIQLCDSMKRKVCGLCGNFDGNKTNDVLDRDNEPIKLLSKINNIRFIPFGNEWRVYDDAKDTDPK